jgi:uncharacterized protein (TIGR00369 family)
MTSTAVADFQALSDSATFNRWAEFQVREAADGESELVMPWRAGEMGQYAGFLHAGLVAALLDTACGLAAASLVGRVLAAQFSMNCLAPARGHTFTARGHVVKAGRTLVFTTGELFAHGDDSNVKLVATASTLLVPVVDPPATS